MLATIPKLNRYLVRIWALSKLDNFFVIQIFFFNSPMCLFSKKYGLYSRAIFS